MNGDLGDLGVLLNAAFLVGERVDFTFEVNGVQWILSAKPVDS